MSLATLRIGRLKHVLRPALVTLMPTKSGRRSVLLDVGANVDCSAEHLVQFAVMGQYYAKDMLGIGMPSIGLLTNGEEESKGNELVRESHKLLKESNLNFIGNVEGRDIFGGLAEVVVCDGFVGNVVLKFAESVVGMFTRTLKKNVGHNIPANVGAILMKPAFRKLKKIMDYQEYGGVPLLGLNKVCVVGHGRSSPKAIRNAIREARKMLEQDLNHKLELEIARNLGA
jgi:glycerol-3-phosphate acyltransferase PlsX